MASAAIRFRDVAPQVEGRQIREHLITVVPLVRDDLVNHPRVVVSHRGHSLQVLSRSRERLRDRRGVTLIGPLDGHAHDGAGLHVDRVLSLIRFGGHLPRGGYDGQNGIKAGRETSATTVL